MLPLFWFVVPPPPQGLHELPLATAMFGPLTTIGSDVPLWFAVLEPSFDCVAVCETVVPDGGVRRSPAIAVPTPPTSPSTRLETSTINRRLIVVRLLGVRVTFGSPAPTHGRGSRTRTSRGGRSGRRTPARAREPRRAGAVGPHSGSPGGTRKQEDRRAGGRRHSTHPSRRGRSSQAVAAAGAAAGVGLPVGGRATPRRLRP